MALSMAPVQCGLCPAGHRPGCWPLIPSRQTAITGRRAMVPHARRRGRMSEADLYASVATPPRASWVSELPLAIRAPLYTFAFLFTVKVVSRILRYRSRSILDQRGYGDAVNPARYRKLQKSLKMLDYAELTPEQMAAGRERRRKDLEREGVPLSLDQIPIPANHPFAVRKELTEEEQRLIEERLNPVQPGERRTRRLSAADEELMRRVQALSAEADPVLVKEQEPRMRG